MWPEYVKDRIHSTYAYFGGSVAITAASAAAIFRSPKLLNIVSRTGWVSLIVSMAALIGSGMAARSIPYQPGFGAKQLTWAAHCAIAVSSNLYDCDKQLNAERIYIYFLGRCVGSNVSARRSNFDPCRLVHGWYCWRSLNGGRLCTQR